MVSHVFEDAEFDGARQSRFQALLGGRNFNWKFLKMHEGQKIKRQKLYQLGVYLCKMMRGFQIWPHYSNRITFDPNFGDKKLKIG